MIPQVTLGTYRIRSSQESINIIKKGIEIGYKSVDTAQGYKNEKMVGEIYKDLKFSFFVTSKISPGNQGEKAYSSVIESLGCLNTTCLDLMLIHWPGSSRLGPDSPLNKVKRLETYDALLKAKKEGLLREIGVSNYTIRHLKELNVAPYLNQIEFHPLVFDDRMKTLLEYSNENNIIVQAYSPLAEGKYLNGDWSDIVEIHEIAKKRSITPAQVLIKWVLEKGVYVVVKSSNVSRLKENFDAQNVNLLKEDIIVLDSLIEKYGYRKSCWDPETIL